MQWSVTFALAAICLLGGVLTWRVNDAGRRIAKLEAAVRELNPGLNI